MPASDREEHYKLRALLTTGSPLEYGHLRREFNISPLRLEYQIETYPAVFAAGMSVRGRPTIRLKEGELESREDLLMRGKLLQLIQHAGGKGIYLHTLYLTTRYPSKEVQRLLSEVPEVEAIELSKAKQKGKAGKVLYKWRGEPEKTSQGDKSGMQESEPAWMKPAEAGSEPEEAELTKARDKLHR